MNHRHYPLHHTGAAVLILARSTASLVLVFRLYSLLSPPSLLMGMKTPLYTVILLRLFSVTEILHDHFESIQWYSSLIERICLYPFHFCLFILFFDFLVLRVVYIPDLLYLSLKYHKNRNRNRNRNRKNT